MDPINMILAGVVIFAFVFMGLLLITWAFDRRGETWGINMGMGAVGVMLLLFAAIIGIGVILSW